MTLEPADRAPASGWEEVEAGPVMPAHAQPHVSTARPPPGPSQQRQQSWAVWAEGTPASDSQEISQGGSGPWETRGDTPGRAAWSPVPVQRAPPWAWLPVSSAAQPLAQRCPGGLSSCPSFLPQSPLSGQHPGPSGPPHGPNSPTGPPPFSRRVGAAAPAPGGLVA